MKKIEKIFKIIILFLLLTFCKIAPSQDYKTHLEKGKKYLNQFFHKEKEALAEMKKAYALNPNDFEVLYFLGRAYYDNREYNEAEEYLERAVELKPDHVEVNAYLAYTYGRIGENLIKRAIYIVKAAKQIKKVLNLNPRFADAYNSLAISCIYLGWFGKPTGLFKEMLEIVFGEWKDTPEYKEIMKYESIPEGCLRMAMKINPKNPWYPTVMGWLYLKTDKKDKAKEEFEKAKNLAEKEIRAGMKNDSVPRAIALYLEEAKMYDEALKYAKIALSWNPKDLCLKPEMSIKRIINRLEEEKKTGKHLLKNISDEL
jgi:tetratricopeptide (TPR) repeat protein